MKFTNDATINIGTLLLLLYFIWLLFQSCDARTTRKYKIYEVDNKREIN